jgi:hypothetical protein
MSVDKPTYAAYRNESLEIRIGTDQSAKELTPPRKKILRSNEGKVCEFLNFNT